MLDSSIIDCLVGILKLSSPNLQRKAASILEFALDTEACFDKIVSADISSALTSALEQKLSVGNVNVPFLSFSFLFFATYNFFTDSQCTHFLLAIKYMLSGRSCAYWLVVS